MKLLVGLGNPGPDYGRTRHNVGFLVADEVARRAGVSFDLHKFAAEIAEARAGREKVWIMKPQTYMNNCGESVGPALRYWKLTLEDLVVVHDDLELDPFRIQVKVGGGHSGNNGVKSVNAHLGSPEYARVRVGIGRPPPSADPADYVLGKFRKSDEKLVHQCVERAATAAWAVVTEGAVQAMNQFNRRQAES